MLGLTLQTSRTMRINKLLKYLPLLLIIPLIVLIYRKFFKKSINTVAVEQVGEVALQNLANGMTYAQAASHLVDSMFSKSFAGTWFRNVDEDALGAYMKTIRPDEYRTLEAVYQAVKTDKLPYVTLGRGGTLTEDIRGAFNSKEMHQYMSHLLQL